MYQVVIVEDDPLSQQALVDMLETHFKDFQITGIYSSVADAIKAIPETELDLLLLDMELQDGKGFQVLESLEEIHFEVVITTMHDSFMLEAIKHSAIDYLMKPVQKKEMATALQNFEKRLAKFNSKKNPVNASSVKSGRLVIPNQNGLILVDIDEIIRLESEGAYTKLMTSSGKVHMTSKNLGYYEKQLHNHDFFRAHHSHLINLSHVMNYVKGDGGHVILSDNSHVDISRRKKDDFLKVLGL
jgi:two-component system LytT family response regulator